MTRAGEQRTTGTVGGGGYGMALWRRKLLIVACLALGLALGIVVLPNVRMSTATYQATVRLKVAEQVSDTIVREQPQFDSGNARLSSGDGNALQDIDLAGRVLRKLGAAAGGLRADEVIVRLTANPVRGSSFVDLTYTDTDPTRASRVAGAYAAAWASRRNAVDAARLKAAVAGLDRQTATLGAEVARLAVPPPAGTVDGTRRAALNRAQSRFNGLVRLRDEILKQQLFLGPPTAVLGGPVTTQVTAPAPRALVIALGLLIGLLAGVGLSLLLEAARPKVLSPADVEVATGLPVIATVPRQGMRGDVPVLKRPFSPASEGYRRVAGSLERRGLGDDVRIVAVASADPAEGKSLLSLNVAHSLARQGRDVVLVSADLRKPRLDRLLGLDGRPGLAEWLQDGATGRLPLHNVAEHLRVVPAGTTTTSPGDLLTTKRLHLALRPLVEAGAVVLVDTPPALWSAEALTLAAAADATLLVARARTSRWRAIEQLAEGLRRDGVREIGIVLLGVRFSRRNRYGLGYVGRHQVDAPVGAAPAPASRAEPAVAADGEARGRVEQGNGAAPNGADAPDVAAARRGDRVP